MATRVRLFAGTLTCLVLAASPAANAEYIKIAVNDSAQGFVPEKEIDGVGHTTQPVRPSYKPLHTWPAKLRVTAVIETGPSKDPADSAEFEPPGDTVSDSGEFFDLLDEPAHDGVTNTGGDPWSRTTHSAGTRAPDLDAPTAPPAIPAPGAFLLLGAGAAGLGRRPRR